MTQETRIIMLDLERRMTYISLWYLTFPSSSNDKLIRLSAIFGTLSTLGVYCCLILKIISVGVSDTTSVSKVFDGEKSFGIPYHWPAILYLREAWSAESARLQRTEAERQ